MGGRKSGFQRFINIVAPLLVVVIPLAAIGWYALYQAGHFQSASNTATASPSVQQTAATITLDSQSALPTSAVPKGKIVPFSFTVTNPGATAASYPYKVSVTWSGGETNVIDLNTLQLAAGAAKTVKESLKFETANATAHITVALQDPPSSIQLTLPRQ